VQGNSVYVQKQGEVYTVQLVDGIPVPVATVDDEPVGAFAFTCTSRKELEATFPGARFVMVEAKPNQTQVQKHDPEIDRQALALLNQQPPPAFKTKIVAVNETGDVLPSGSMNAKQKAEEFLKRLQTALQYASKKHQKNLQAQVQIVEELINEVFKS